MSSADGKLAVALLKLQSTMPSLMQMAPLVAGQQLQRYLILVSITRP